jgi:branched-chain amino acid transport system substrate-binding protein
MARMVRWLGFVLLGLVFAVPAGAQGRDTLKVGIIVSATGPAASLGVPEQNTAALLRKNLGEVPVQYLVRDDGTDTTAAVREMRKLIQDENVDLVIGSSVTPATLAMTEVAAEKAVPIITLAAASTLIQPVEGPRRWVFKTPQNDSMMAEAILDHMAASGIKTLGFIGFSDALGESWWQEVSKHAPARGLTIVSTQRFARADTSVTGQVLKIVAEKPDAVLVAAYGTPAALPQKTLKERGYSGQIYQTHGVANQDFLRVVGKDGEGTFLPVGPMVVASQLPESNPIKAVALEYIAAYEGRYGPGTASAFGSYLWDAERLLAAALPAARKAAQPGTPEFRAALRDAIEAVRDLVTTNGVVNMSPTDHLGLDNRARVMVKIEGGNWRLLPGATQ